MENVMKTFDRTNAWNPPVVENGKYIGFVSKSKYSTHTSGAAPLLRRLNIFTHNGQKGFKIVFFGTPEFAVASLGQARRRLTIACLRCRYARQASRQRPPMIQSGRKAVRLEKGLCILQPERLKDETFVSQLERK